MTTTPAHMEATTDTQFGDSMDSIERLNAALTLPAKIDLTYRCDRCNAQALHAFALPTPGGPAPLYTCNHHGREYHNQGMVYLAHRDYRQEYTGFLTDRDKARKAAIEANRKENQKLVSNAGSPGGDRTSTPAKDDAGTSIATHLSQWDVAAGHWH